MNTTIYVLQESNIEVKFHKRINTQDCTYLIAKVVERIFTNPAQLMKTWGPIEHWVTSWDRFWSWIFSWRRICKKTLTNMNYNSIYLTLSSPTAFLGPKPDTKDIIDSAWECSIQKLMSTPTSLTLVTSSISKACFSWSWDIAI